MRNLYVLLLVVLLCGGSLGHGRNDSTRKPSHSHNEQNSSQKVFIMTLPRSGSTFAGELFRQNPDFVYLFEPLRAFSEQFTWDGCRATPHNENLADIMTSLYNCNFTALKDNLPDWGPLYGWDRIAHFSGQSDACLPPASDEPRARKLSIAVKEIEIWGPKLDWLHSLLNEELFVIWLIRDVRGWVSSWVVPNDEGSTFFNDWSINDMDIWNFYAGCDDALMSLKMLDTPLLAKIKEILKNKTSEPYLKMASWWTLDMAVSHYYISSFKGNAKLVRYEDLASYPQKYAENIYSFLHRPTLPEQVSSYIQTSTKGGDVAERYNTVRNSTAMTEIWRTRLSILLYYYLFEISFKCSNCDLTTNSDRANQRYRRHCRSVVSTF
jgi:hypothetical protein